MDNVDWLPLIHLTEDLLYMMIAFMCGMIIGYIAGRMDNF